MLYKFGGIYLDLDFVTLNSLTHYQNIVVTGKNISRNLHENIS